MHLEIEPNPKVGNSKHNENGMAACNTIGPKTSKITRYQSHLK